jgi:hypothetical protein
VGASGRVVLGETLLPMLADVEVLRPNELLLNS